jgi:hypothetical protein
VSGQDGWRRQRRRHRDIENAVDDVGWAAGNLNDALKPNKGCALAALALGGGALTALIVAGRAVGEWLA